jgi:serine/threonine protein kinase
VHTTEEVQTPLHCALLRPYSAPLQTAGTIKVLLQSYLTSRHGTFVNGKLALKMEDAAGQFPLHYAAFHHACLDVMQLLLETYPKAARLTNADGDLPLHCLLDPEYLFESSSGTGRLTGGATLATPMGWISESESEFYQHQLKVHQECMALLVHQLLIFPIDRNGIQGSGADSALHPLHIASSAHGMLPLHIVVAFDAVDYSTIYSMLDQFPESAMAWTTGIPGHKYTALDLHEMRRAAAESTPADDGISTATAIMNAGFAKWMNVRELLFAFGPNVAELRHKDDLLEQCARVVRDEAEGKGSVHATEFMAWMEQQLQQQGGLEVKQTPSAVGAPHIDRGFKSKRGTVPSAQGAPSTYFSPQNKGKPAAAIPPIKMSTKEGEEKEKPKSIYDDDEFDHRYTVSKDDGDEDGDDYFDDDEDFLGDEEYDESYRNADDFDEENDDDETGTYGSYTYDSRTFDDTVDSRTIDSRTIGSRTIGSRTMDSRTIASKRRHKEDDARTLEETESVSRRGRKFDGSLEQEKKEEGVIEAPFLSDVAMRLWTFFVLFHNPEDARDNYSKKVEMILAEVPFPTVKELTSLLLPPYAQQYLPKLIAVGEAKTLEEVAHNACKAVIHKACYFIGRYEFQASAQDNLVIHHTDDNMIVCVRAMEHSINIEEVINHEEETGKAEEDIWKTGAADEFVDRTVESVFQVTSRKVCIKFMRSQQAYLREVQCRQGMGITVEGTDSSKNFVVPLINHFSSVGESTRPADVRFKFDVKDERFKTLDLGGGETISPFDFPYAVVLPFRDDGDLFDYFLHHGRLDKTVIREIGLQVGKALQAIHQKGLVHGNVSLQSIALVAPTEDSDEVEPYWALTDLSGACNQSTSLMAGIPSTGAANFMTCSFPPELYVKLSTPEVKIYNAYWDAIKTKYNVDVDTSVVSPHVDPATGDSHVLRCHYEPDDESTEELPPLPYKLVPAREPSDIWSFGRVMFTLCTAGHPMFPTNIKTGHLLAYDQVANFDHAKARELIYKHVEDPLAQDLLFHLLSNYEQRSAVTMEKILDHPFFCAAENDIKNREKVIQQISAHRAKESAAYMRSLREQNMKQAEGEWVTHRSKNLHCWSLDFSMRMHLAPSTLLRLEGAPDIPYGVVLLPYKLARNKAGKLTPSTKKDVERAEKMGIQLLALVKACQFAARMETIVEDPKYFGKTWTSSDIVSEMFLHDDPDYEEHKKLLIYLAAAQIEQFRDDPMVVTRRIIQQRIVEVQDCIVTDSPEAWLYLVDEFAGIPVLAAPYPMKVSEKTLEVMQRTLPLMHLSVLYHCAVVGSISGLVKLIFEAAYPHLPPSWTAASEGVKFALNKTDLEQQVAMLRVSLAELYSLDKNNQALDDVKFLQNYLQKRDTKNSYAKMKRVTNGEAAMWTASVESIEKVCKDHDIYQEYDKQKEMQAKLEKQELRIKELETALEMAEFKRKHNIIDVVD